MQINRINRACKYFPCHKGLEDCTFCYCPFYPCMDNNFGRYVYSDRLGKEVWSCKDCNWPHKKKKVDYIHGLIRKNRNMLRGNNNDNVRDTGVVIIGHGSRLKGANSTIDEVIKLVKKELKLSAIMPAYLQLSEPNLTESVENLARRGCKKIIVVPFFLFNGNHVSRDIPEVLKDEIAKYPEIKFTYTKNLSQDLRIGGIVIDRIREAITRCQ